MVADSIGVSSMLRVDMLCDHQGAAGLFQSAEGWLGGTFAVQLKAEGPGRSEGVVGPAGLRHTQFKKLQLLVLTSRGHLRQWAHCPLLLHRLMHCPSAQAAGCTLSVYVVCSLLRVLNFCFASSSVGLQVVCQ